MDLWKLRGECGKHDPDIWFPVSNKPDAYEPAKAICAACPVRGQCLDYAIDNAISDGVWGALAPVERDLLAMRPRLTAGALPSDQVEHGTPGGYMWHRRYSLPACDACHDAELDRGRARRKARRSEMAS